MAGTVGKTANWLCIDKVFIGNLELVALVGPKARLSESTLDTVGFDRSKESTCKTPPCLLGQFDDLTAYPANLCPLSCGVEFADL